MRPVSTDEPGQNPAPIVPPVNPTYPLLHPVIARQLGIYRFTEREADKILARTRKVFETYAELHIPLLSNGDTGEPWTADNITLDLVLRHKNLITNERIMSDEEFEENLLNIISNHTGVPRVSYRRITREGLRLDQPWMIVQEIDDRYHSEKRRVEWYPDGRLLWRIDGEAGHGTAEEEFTESLDVPGLSIINDRPGRKAEEITREDFEGLWVRGYGGHHAALCRFPASGYSYLDDKPDELPSCNGTREGESAFCEEHGKQIRAVFPFLFERQ